MHKALRAIFLISLILAQNFHVLAQDAPSIEDTFTQEQREKISKTAESHPFQADVNRVMDIIINSLYTQKDIFLRECISNAADALDKIRFLSVQNPDVLGEQPELSIRITADKEAKTLTIQDTGIGMTKADLINNLGTIAKTGTTEFIEALAKGAQLNLIGQFGVGFYSYFLVATKVQVTSKHNDDDQYVWESSAGQSFTVTKDPRGNTLKRGTRITLFLKEDTQEFSDTEKAKTLVKRFSEFINFPIYLYVQKEVSKEVEVTDEEEAADVSNQDETKKEGEQEDDLKIKDQDESASTEKKKKTKQVKESVWDWELVNDNKAIWTRSKDEITEDEYNKFYKSISKDYDDSLTWIHFRGEGEVEFLSLLFIPKHAAHDQFENYHGKSSSLKLYVRRVFISEQFEDLMPKYLNFIKGVVDSDDLPLHVSRESLQQQKMLKFIQRKLVRKVLEMIKGLASIDDVEDNDEESDGDDENKSTTTKPNLDEMDEKEREELQKKKEDRAKEKKEQYKKFFKEFGKNIKLGIIEDPGNRGKLAELVRFYSTFNKDDYTSLDDYIDRAKKSQDAIYYVAGDTRENLLKSPLISGLLKRGYEILLLDDPIDEYCLSHLSEYEKKKLVNVGKADFKFPEEDDDKRSLKKLKKLYQPLTEWLKKLLKDTIESVQVSLKLVNDPAIVIASEHGQSANMEKMTKSQAYANPDRINPYANMKKILEINPYHPYMKELLERVKGNIDEETEDMAKLLYETSLLNSGYSINDPQTYARRFYKVYSEALGLQRDAKVEEFDLEDSEVEEVRTKADETQNLDEGNQNNGSPDL